MNTARWLTLVLVMAAAARCIPAEPDAALRIESPRAYGYTIGDIVTRHVSAEAPANYVLNREQLPQPRRLNAWVVLRSLRVEKVAAGVLTRYSLRADYQLLNSPLALRTVSVPGWHVEFTGPGAPMQKPIPAFTVSIAPLADATGDFGLESIRPDRLPPLLATQPYVYRLALAALFAAILAASWYWVAFGSPFTRTARRPFARAYRDLRGIARSPFSPETFRAALQRLHRAFDESAGRTLFAEHLDAFFADRPGADGLRAATVDFFALSRGEFFAADAAAPAQSLKSLLQFCRRWRERERFD